MTYALIFFVMMGNATTASVRVNFSSDANCAAAARELTDKLKALNQGADVVWACVKQ